MSDFVMITIPFDEEVLASMTDVTNNVPNNDEEKIIQLILGNNKISTEQMAATLGKSKKTVQRIINNSQKITRVGPKFGGHWKIKE